MHFFNNSLQGFEQISERLRDSHGTPMLLKLKDWPPSTDIAEYMPMRFRNLFDAFTMPGKNDVDVLSVCRLKTNKSFKRNDPMVLPVQWQ
jgi:hypothetical protein